MTIQLNEMPKWACKYFPVRPDEKPPISTNRPCRLGGKICSYPTSSLEHCTTAKVDPQKRSLIVITRTVTPSRPSRRLKPTADVIVHLFKKASLGANKHWMVTISKAKLSPEEVQDLYEAGFLEQRHYGITDRWFIPKEHHDIAKAFRKQYAPTT